MSETKPGSFRRGFLLTGVAACSGVAGTLFGYKDHDQLKEWDAQLRGDPPSAANQAQAEFAEQARQILERQAQQKVETVKQLKAKYESPIYGKVRVWDLVEKLALCIDSSDPSLMCASQYIHVQQILESMEDNVVRAPDLLLVALLHDLGKVMLLTGEAPENVVGYISPMGEYPRGAGLDQVMFQFGHDEMIYSRIKDHVPEHVAWTVRYHSTVLSEIDPYLSDRERVWRDQYLVKFQPYDQGTKSYLHLPTIDMARYRALIEDTFPQPILI